MAKGAKWNVSCCEDVCACACMCARARMCVWDRKEGRVFVASRVEGRQECCASVFLSVRCLVVVSVCSVLAARGRTMERAEPYLCVWRRPGRWAPAHTAPPRSPAERQRSITIVLMSAIEGQTYQYNVFMHRQWNTVPSITLSKTLLYHTHMGCWTPLG